MKLFYRIDPAAYKEAMDKIKSRFDMHEEVDEAKTMLMLDGDSPIELVSGSYDPAEDEVASVRVVLHDASLKEVFDSILGEPFRVK